MKHEFLSLSDLLGVLKARVVPILLAGLIFGALVFGVTALMPKEYSATSGYYVRNLQSQELIDRYGINSSQAAAAQTMAIDFADVVLQSDQLLSAAIAEGNLNCTAQALQKMLSVEVSKRSAAFYLTVTSRDKDFAVKAAQAIEKVLPRVVTDLAFADAKEDFTAVALLSTAGEAKQSAPRYKLLTGIGALAGFFLAYVIFLAASFFGSVVKNEEDLVRALPDCPVVGRVPHWNGMHGDRTGGKE